MTLATWTWAGAGVALLTLDNPPMNTLGRATLAAIDTCLAALEAEPDARALVVTGAGPRAFSAGADIKEFPAMMAEAAGAGGVALPGQRAFDRLTALPLPTIAAIEGVALGGGLELALACDLRVVAEGARLGLPETGLGLFPCYGGTQRLPRLVGAGAAKDLIFSGRTLTAEEALRLRLCERLAPAGSALATALEWAAALAARPRQALRAAKAAIDSGAALSLADGQAIEAALADDVFQSEDAREGVAAFLAKRPARFVHR